MSTVVINVDDRSSAKLFLDLAKKMHLKARILTEGQKESLALRSIMEERAGETTLPVQTALDILRKVK